MTKKNKGGRPLKFATPKILQNAVDLYFESLTVPGKDGDIVTPPTVSGLAYHLDIDTRTLVNYELKDKFFPIIKRAKQRVQIALEQRLYGNAPVGAIFNLKCNFGMIEARHEERDNGANDIIDALNEIAGKLPD